MSVSLKNSLSPNEEELAISYCLESRKCDAFKKIFRQQIFKKWFNFELTEIIWESQQVGGQVPRRRQRGSSEPSERHPASIADRRRSEGSSAIAHPNAGSSIGSWSENPWKASQIQRTAKVRFRSTWIIKCLYLYYYVWSIQFISYCFNLLLLFYSNFNLFFVSFILLFYSKPQTRTRPQFRTRHSANPERARAGHQTFQRIWNQTSNLLHLLAINNINNNNGNGYISDESSDQSTHRHKSRVRCSPRNGSTSRTGRTPRRRRRRHSTRRFKRDGTKSGTFVQPSSAWLIRFEFLEIQSGLQQIAAQSVASESAFVVEESKKCFRKISVGNSNSHSLSQSWIEKIWQFQVKWRRRNI